MKKLLLLIFIFTLKSNTSFAQEKTTDNWIVKWNATSSIDIFSFPTLQFAVEKKINTFFSVQLESGIQAYDFRKTDTIFTKTKGVRLITEGRFYLSSYLKRKKLEIKNSKGFYTGIQLFYRKNYYNYTQEYYQNEADYENFTNLQSDVLGVKKEVYGFNFCFGYQIPHKRFIFEPYIYIGTLYRNIKNSNREFNSELGHIANDYVHYYGSDLEEESNNGGNFSFGFRIGYKL